MFFGWTPLGRTRRAQPVAAEMIACPDCGSLQDWPPLPFGTNAVCRLCDTPLERTNGRSVTATLGCSLATFFLLFPGNLLPLLSVRIFGMHNATRLGAGVFTLWDHGWPLLAALIGAFAVVLPFVRFGLLSTVLGALWLGHRAAWLGAGFRWAIWLDVWAMPDVFLLSLFVGYFRLVHVPQMDVRLGAGGYCFVAAALLTMVSRAALDRRAVWRSIGPDASPPTGQPVLSCTVCDLVQPLNHAGARCPRCRARLYARKPFAVLHATALTLAAFALFFPANILPMNVSLQLGSRVEYTIFRGVRELFKAGLWPLGIIIFCASIGIPALKIFGMAWFILSVRRRSRRHLILRTKTHRFINEIGRWSNLDPFTLAVFVPLMTFPPLAGSTAAWGATAFIAVVVLTLLASMSFDPRLMWDAAERSAP